jgi:hypothetical protein
MSACYTENGHSRVQSKCPLSAADSIGHRNTSPRSSAGFIEPQGNPVQARLREMQEICSPREILSQQAVGVLGSAFCFGVNHVRAFTSIRIPPHLESLEGVASIG